MRPVRLVLLGRAGDPQYVQVGEHDEQEEHHRRRLAEHLPHGVRLARVDVRLAQLVLDELHAALLSEQLLVLIVDRRRRCLVDCRHRAAVRRCCCCCCCYRWRIVVVGVCLAVDSNARTEAHVSTEPVDVGVVDRRRGRQRSTPSGRGSGGGSGGH